MPGVESLGETITFTGTLAQEALNHNLTDLTTEIYQPIVNCAYDPNDKQVLPNNLGNTEYTLFGDTLTYTIRFQNTGTDTAFTVRLVDRLDNDLDWSSFQLISSSHDMQYSLSRVGLLTFLYEDILLPDSTTNEPASHGFVKFRILHKTGLPEQTLITNSAQIFFDFNPPILTNTTRSLLVSQQPFLAFRQNPSCFDSTDGSLEIIFPVDSLTYTWSTGEEGIKIAGLAEGSYGVTATDNDGNIINSSNFNVFAPNQLALEDVVVLDVSCFGEAAGLIDFTIRGGVGPYQVMINGQPGELPLDELSEGAYDLRIVDANGCILEEGFTLSGPAELAITPTITDEVDGGENGSITTTVVGGTPPYSYQWNTGATQESIANLMAGDYTLTVTDSLSCSVEATFTVDMIVGTGTAEERLFLRIFPNPTAGAFKLQVQVPQSSRAWRLDIIDTQGKTVATYDQVENTGQFLHLTPPILSSGLYLVRLQTQEFQTEQKLIIMQ